MDSYPDPIECPFCGRDVPEDVIVDHVATHFTHTTRAAFESYHLTPEEAWKEHRMAHRQDVGTQNG